MWKKPEMPLLHLHGPMSPVDISIVSTVDQGDEQISPLTPLGMNVSLLVLPGASAREQDRMLMECITRHIISYSVFYFSFGISSESVSDQAH